MTRLFKVTVAAAALAALLSYTNAATQVVCNGQLPNYIVENRGVFPDVVQFYAKGREKTLFFTSSGVMFQIRGRTHGCGVEMTFVGAREGLEPVGTCVDSAIISYFKGPENDWKTGLRTFSRVVYHEVWPGIDVVFRTGRNRIKYDVIVKPYADPRAVKFAYRGASDAVVADDGSLRIHTRAGTIVEDAPVGYQEINGKRLDVRLAFRVEKQDERFVVSFATGEYDRTVSLVIDPAYIVYCGYIGGDKETHANGISVDAAGNAYVAGDTRSDESRFPVVVGPYLKKSKGYVILPDAFVAKVDPSGRRLLYCGYIGGTDYDSCDGIAVDVAGNAYAFGVTYGCGFPNTQAWRCGTRLGFIVKVEPTGTKLGYSFVMYETFDDVAVDAKGNVYFVGTTSYNESQFRSYLKTGPDLTYNGGNCDAFVGKLSDIANILYCGYIGGLEADYATGIVVDGKGNAYVAGWTESDEKTFPVKVGPDLTQNGMYDAFVCKVLPDGSSLEFCGFIGGSLNNGADGIDIDAAGNTYIVGCTDSDDTSFPVKVGPDLTTNGWVDVFVTKIAPGGKGLVYSGFIGGVMSDFPGGIRVDAAGQAVIVGDTLSDENSFPVRVGPDTSHNSFPFPDVFIAIVAPTGVGLAACGYIGGSRSDVCNAVDLDRSGNVYIAGETTSDQHTFPVRVGPDLTYNVTNVPYEYDGFVAKIAYSVLHGSGAPRPGSTIDLTLTATEDAGLQYQLGSSFGTGPIQLDNRKLHLSPDPLLVISTAGYWPWVFSGYKGTIDSTGHAAAKIEIPSSTALVGTAIHSAFVTLDGSKPSGVKSISNTCSIQITP